MKMQQIAVAVFNDRATETARAAALAHFAAGASWDGAVQRLLPAVFAELKKPIYAGVEFDATAWTAAAEVLDLEIAQATAARELAADRPPADFKPRPARGYLSTSGGRWRVISQALPVSDDKATPAAALAAARQLGLELEAAAWNGDRGEWVWLETIAELEGVQA